MDSLVNPEVGGHVKALITTITRMLFDICMPDVVVLQLVSVLECLLANEARIRFSRAMVHVAHQLTFCSVRLSTFQSTTIELLTTLPLKPFMVSFQITTVFECVFTNIAFKPLILRHHMCVSHG